MFNSCYNSADGCGLKESQITTEHTVHKFVVIEPSCFDVHPYEANVFKKQREPFCKLNLYSPLFLNIATFEIIFTITEAEHNINCKSKPLSFDG